MIPSVAQCKTEFERARRRRKREPMQFTDIRWEALDRFLSLGFPTSEEEEWRFTSVSAIADEIFTLAAEPIGSAYSSALAPLRRPDVFATELVFVNGYYVADASVSRQLPSGASAESLATILESSPTRIESHLTCVAAFERHPFVALNTALFADGACVSVPAHTVVEQPIHVRFISTGEADMRPAMSHPRVLVVVEDGGRASVVESYLGSSDVQYLTNAVTEIVLGEGAVLEHYKIQQENTAAYHIATTQVVAARRANCSAHSLSLGGAVARNETVVLLAGDHATCALHGLSLADGARLLDTHTTIEHVTPQATSRNVFKALLADQAAAVFDGKILVGPYAEKTDARQTCRALLVSEAARFHATAQAETLAQPLACLQRASARQLDDDAEFYGRTRGVGPAEARRLAITRFVRDVRQWSKPSSLGGELETLLHAYLDRVYGTISG